MKKIGLLFSVIYLWNVVNAQLNRYPYIQSTTATSTIVAWKTAQAETGAVAYGLSASSMNDTIVENTNDIRHAVTISNLVPNTKYYYAILSNGVVLASEYFYTAKDTTNEDFTFIQYGDCGFNSSVQRSLATLMEADTAEFAVVCGDVDQGGVPHISQSSGGDNYDDVYFDIYNDGINTKMLSRECHYTAIGNHDVYANNGATYDLEFHLPHNNADSSERYYSFTWGDAKFIALDVITPFDPTAFPLNQQPINQRWWTDFRQGSQQYQFLEDELRCNDKKWVFVYFHEGPWTNYWGADYYLPNALGGDYYQYDGNEMVRQHLVPLFEQYGVDFVMVGHSHLYEKATKNGVWYITSGGAGDVGGNTQYANHPEILLAIVENHYIQYNVAGNTVSYKAINQNSNVIDSFSYTKPYTEYNVASVIESPTCFNGQDASIQLTIDGPKAPYTVEWFNGQTGTSISGLSAGTYYAFIRNQYGCEKVSEFVIPETEMDTAHIYTLNDVSSFCTGDSLYLQADSGYLTYNWSNGQSGISTYVNTVGQVSVSIQNSNNCLVYTETINVSEVQQPIANFGYANNDSAFNFLATDINNVTYYWNFDDGTYDTTQNSLHEHVFAQNGTYNVSLVIANECGSDTIIKSVVVNTYEETGIRNIVLQDEISIIPNPLKNHATINIGRLYTPVKVQIFDTRGVLVEQFTMHKIEHIITSEGKASGLYFIKAFDAKGNLAIEKLLVE